MRPDKLVPAVLFVGKLAICCAAVLQMLIGNHAQASIAYGTINMGATWRLRS